MTDIVKKEESSVASLSKGKLKSTSTPFRQRVAQAKAEQPDASTMPNRICLMLDRSSSMSSCVPIQSQAYAHASGGSKSKIELLKEAIDNFVNRCDFSNTSIAVETFPASLELALSNVGVMITSSVAGIHASGNTPMRACVQSCLEKVPMTRGIIVSDGEATDWHGMMSYDYSNDEDVNARGEDSLLALYKKASIPIDCVHIGDSSSGEELLRRIAKETGGIYLKFTDVSAFATAFGFLTPGYRAQLTDGRVSAEQLGAKEVRR